MQSLRSLSPATALRNLAWATILAVATFLFTSDTVSAQPQVDSITGVIVDEVTVQTGRHPSRVVTIDADDGNSYRVATVGGLTPEGEYLFASHQARLPMGHKVSLEVAPAPQARLDDFLAGGFAVDDGDILYQTANGELGETILHKVESVNADGSLSASVALRDSYGDFEMHWEKFPVPIYLNTGGGPVSASDQIAAAKMAVGMWNIVSCSDLTVRFAGTTTIGGSRTTDNGVNLVYWDADYFVKSGHPYRLGETWRRFDPSDWTFTDVEFVLNSGQKMEHPGGNMSYDMASVMAHEIGHGLGFHHVGNSSNIMNTSLSETRTLRQLGQLDVDAVHYLYPGSCFGSPNIRSAQEVKSISCFGPNASANAEEIIVLPDPEPGEPPTEQPGAGTGEVTPEPGGGSSATGSSPTDIAVEPAPKSPLPAGDSVAWSARSTPRAPRSPLPAGGSTTSSAEAIQPSQGTAAAVSALTSDDSSADFTSWDNASWDDTKWDEAINALTLGDWFIMSAGN